MEMAEFSKFAQRGEKKKKTHRITVATLFTPLIQATVADLVLSFVCISCLNPTKFCYRMMDC